MAYHSVLLASQAKIRSGAMSAYLYLSSFLQGIFTLEGLSSLFIPNMSPLPRRIKPA